MPGYADFTKEPSYKSKRTGAQLEVVITNEADPSDYLIAAVTGLSPSEDYETVPIEELGKSGVDEIAQGRHSGTVSIPGFWSAENNDRLQTRQNFQGKKYTIMERIAPGWPGAGNVVNVFVGCVNSQHSSQAGARGAVTVNLSFTYTTRYNGKEWAALVP